MKKSIFILAALFAATIANAQITLEHSFAIESGYTSECLPYLPCSYINSMQLFTNKGYVTGVQELPCSYYMNITFKDNKRIKDLIFINPEDFSTYKTLNLSSYDISFSYESLCAIAYDIFSVDKIALIFKEQSSGNLVIIDEDGIELMRINCYGRFNRIMIDRINNQWKLIVPAASSEDRYTLSSVDIYSLPGDGSEPDFSQATNTLSSPKRSARKITREGQVLVETENNTYDLKGQEVK